MTSMITRPAGLIASAFEIVPLDAFVGRRVAEHREALGMDREIVSADVGITPDLLELVEAGVMPAPDILLYRLSRCLKASISDFFAARVDEVAG